VPLRRLLRVRFRADFMRNVRELDEDLADRELDPETRLNY